MQVDRNTRVKIARAALIGFLSGGAVVGIIICVFFRPTPQPVKALRESDIPSSSGYTFTDPLIGVSAGGPTDAPEYTALRNQVQAYLTSQMGSGLTTAAVKFGDIEAQEGFTLNPDQAYDPASLTKVPLAMAYYELAEQNPSVLQERIVYSGEPDLDVSEQIKSNVQLIPGQGYTVEQLIEHMIRYSDNNAEQLLADHLAQAGKLDALNSLFGDLGIKVNPSNPDYMTVQSYSLFLRVLFNTTYLDRTYSEKLLQLLSEVDFTSGISKGLPEGVTVSQKFGDARVPNSSGSIVGAELQNCGIVYYPDHPYLLCIMTKGSSISDLERVIANISQIIYQGMGSRYSA